MFHQLQPPVTVLGILHHHAELCTSTGVITRYLLWPECTCFAGSEELEYIFTYLLLNVSLLIKFFKAVRNPDGFSVADLMQAKDCFSETPHRPDGCLKTALTKHI